jgi:hypothetical protein
VRRSKYREWALRALSPEEYKNRFFLRRDGCSTFISVDLYFSKISELGIWNAAHWASVFVP